MRMALEERINHISREQGIDITRLRRHVAFDRFLARLFCKPIDGLVVKGGYILELRLERARLTKDIDFSFTGDLGGIWNGKPDRLQTFIQKNVSSDLGDFFSFIVGSASLELENAPYGGFRFSVNALMAERKFITFSVDIAAGDAWFEPHETLPTHDWFDFAGIPGGVIPVISMEQQFSEKLHSYTQSRNYQNSRVKDLVDMVLIIKNQKMSIEKVNEISKATFAKRNNSPYPPELKDPPENWRVVYSALARECGVEENIDKAVEIIRGYCESAGIIQY